MIVIIDYSLGNPGSVLNMFKRQGIPATISSDPEIVTQATHLVLGGVGAFDQGIANIEATGLREVIDEKVKVERIPVIGFCLGMQLMTRGSEEGERQGLGWIDAQTVHLRTFREQPAKALKFPQISWNYVFPSMSHPLLDGIPEPMRFYFVHSYKVVCANKDDVLMRCVYGGIPFTAAFVNHNIVGLQFHPEKSHKYGQRLLANFAKWQPSCSAATALAG